jgi:hypothetical protein
MMFTFGKLVAEPSAYTTQVRQAMVQWYAPSPTLLPLISRDSFAAPFLATTLALIHSNMKFGR